MSKLRINIMDAPDTLCSKCENAWIRKSNIDWDIQCTASLRMVTQITEKITVCNRFHEINTPHKFDLEPLAWTINLDKSGNVIGFKPPEEDKF